MARLGRVLDTVLPVLASLVFVVVWLYVALALFTDSSLPQDTWDWLSGLELVREVGAERPDLICIVISGYAGAPDIATDCIAQGIENLQLEYGFDINGDGSKDLITGKRFFAHNGKDPGANEPRGERTPRTGSRPPSGELLERLSKHAPKETRYRMLGEVARGGVGIVEVGVLAGDDLCRRTRYIL